MTSIHQVKNKESLKDFINYPYQLYKDNTAWVSQLKYSEKYNIDILRNPFYKNIEAKFYLAKKENQVAGRIASIFDKRTLQGYFGFLHADNDSEVFRLLLEKIESDLNSKDTKRIIGPVSPSINYEMGVLVKGFLISPYIMMPYNYEYYDVHIKNSGYIKAKDFYAFGAYKSEVKIPEKVFRIMKIVQKKYNVNLRKPNMDDFFYELKKIENIYNNSMTNHWGFVPMDTDEFEYLGSELKNIIDPNMVFIAEIDNEPIGFILCLSNYNEIFKKIRNGKIFPTGLIKIILNRRKIKGLRVAMLGVRQEFQPKGIGSILYYNAIVNMLSSRYEQVEFSWIIEDNIKVLKIAELIGAKHYKTYRLYKKV